MLELQITQTRHPKSVAGQTDGVDSLLDLRFAKAMQVKIHPSRSPFVITRQAS